MTLGGPGESLDRPQDVMVLVTRAVCLKCGYEAHGKRNLLGEVVAPFPVLVSAAFVRAQSGHPSIHAAYEGCHGQMQIEMEPAPATLPDGLSQGSDSTRGGQSRHP